MLPKAVETIQRLFGIPRDNNDQDSIRIKWSHELRGFRPEEGKKNNVLDNFSDLSLYVLSPLVRCLMIKMRRIGRLFFYEVQCKLILTNLYLFCVCRCSCLE